MRSGASRRCAPPRSLCAVLGRPVVLDTTRMECPARCWPPAEERECGLAPPGGAPTGPRRQGDVGRAGAVRGRCAYSLRDGRGRQPGGWLPVASDEWRRVSFGGVAAQQGDEADERL